MRIILLLLFVLSTVIFPNSASATYLRMLSTAEVTIHPDTKKVDIKVTITNDGDENAKNVSIEIPALKQKFLLAGDLAPAKSETLTLNTTFSELGISSIGRYSIPFRVLYSDGIDIPSQ